MEGASAQDGWPAASVGPVISRLPQAYHAPDAGVRFDQNHVPDPGTPQYGGFTWEFPWSFEFSWGVPMSSHGFPEFP